MNSMRQPHHAEAAAGEQFQGGKYNAAYRADDFKFSQFLIPPGKRVLELGCGRGDLLASLRPSHGVGVVPMYVRNMRSGQLVLNQSLKVLSP